MIDDHSLSNVLQIILDNFKNGKITYKEKILIKRMLFIYEFIYRNDKYRNPVYGENFK